MTKTRLYLDVDGVINAELAHTKWGGLQRVGKAHGFTIRHAPAMVARLSKLDVELVWLTTWRDEAPARISPLIGWGHKARVLHPRTGATTYPSIHWKEDALVFDQQDDPSPFLWFDDEIEDRHKTLATLIGGKAIAPNPLWGITPEHLDKADKYLSGH